MQGQAPIRVKDNEQIENINHFVDTSKIKGWGVDADPMNDPTYPMKTRVENAPKSYDWDRPQQQRPDVEVLHSNERPNLSATFGTTIPPSGLSGIIRREAFKFSENSLGHWLPLMLADRIGVVEGLLSDLGRGHVPNIFGELGWKAEWKYNRKALVTKVAVGAAAVSILAFLLTRKREER